MGERSFTIVHTESSLGWGGQEIRILTEAQGMRQRGHKVTILCPRESKIYTQAVKRGLRVIAMPIARKNWRGLSALRSWIQAHPPQIINTHSSTDTWLVALGSLGVRPKPVLVRTRHVSAAVTNNFTTRWLYQTATHSIVTTGDALRAQLIANNNIAAEKIVSVPTGIDLTHYVPGDKAKAKRALGISNQTIVIGIVATLRSWKGHRFLLQAFADLAAPNVKLLIVGDGPQQTAITEQVTSLGVAAAVLMPGNQHDVLPWLNAMDIFVLPSYANEGVPQALLQAMACELPVITTPVGSILEVAQHEHTALIVPPQDAKALEQALRRLMTDASLRQRLGSAARQQALQRFGVDQMLDSMEKVFKNALT